MTKKVYIGFIITLSILFSSNIDVFGETPVWNVTVVDNPAPGYLKFDWYQFPYFFLADNYGSKIYTHNTYTNSGHYKLLSNGYWINISKKKYYIYNSDLILVDSIPVPSNYETDIHEVDILKNGHYLLLCKERVLMDLSEIVDGGNQDATIISNVLVETDRDGVVYWEWKALDYLSITDVTEDIDLTVPTIDFTHANSFTEDENGNIWISFRHLDEITKINKTTGHIVWRMGGSKCKNNEFTFTNDRINNFDGFSHQHSISITANGNLLLFDNGNLKVPQYSRAVEYRVNQLNKQVTKVWEYRYSPDVYQNIMGSTYRLPNGNTLINWGNTKITEVKPDKSIAFEMNVTNSNNTSIYRAYRFIAKMNSVSMNINGNGNYNFSNLLYETDVDLSINSLTGNGLCSIEKHNYSPYMAHFNDSTFSAILPYRWVFSQTGISNISGTIKINMDSIHADDLSKVTIYKRSQEAKGFFSALNTNYNSQTNELSANFSGFGEFVIGSNVLNRPVLSLPENLDSNITLDCILKWNKSLGAKYYQLQISRDSNFSTTDINEPNLSKLEYNCKNLGFNNKYYWRLCAYNTKDTSEWSDVFNFSTEKLNGPDLIYPDDKGKRIHLSDNFQWNEISNADFYWLQVSIDSNFTSLSINNKQITKTTYSISELNGATKYFWRVAVIKKNSTSNWSQVRTFDTRLNNPVLISPVLNSINLKTDISLIWNSVNKAKKYLVEVSEFSDFRNHIIYSEVNDTIWTYTEYKKSRDYHCRVKALNELDTSNWSEIIKFSTLLETPILIYPEDNFSNVPVNATFSWNSVDSANSYQLQISTNSDLSGIFYEVKFEKNLYNKVDLPPNSRVYWRVKAFNNKKNSDWSEIWSANTGSRIPLTIPKLVYPKNNSNKDEDGEFVWMPVDRAKKYQLIVSTNEEFTSVVLDTNIMDFASCYYSDFNQDKYYWKVRVFSLFDSSEWSDDWIFNIKDKSPIVKLISPENDQMQVPLNGQLEWDKIDNADSYDIQLADNPEFNNPIMDVPEFEENIANYSYLDYRRTYYWRVRFRNNDNISQWSNVWSFKTITEEVLEKPILLSPSEFEKSIPVNCKLKWGEVLNANFYSVSLSNEKSFQTTIDRVNNITDTEFELNNLEYNKKYYWRVSASNEYSESPWSDVYSFTTLLETPTILYPVNYSLDQPLNGKLQWTVSEDISLYNIQISTENNFDKPFINIEDIYELLYDYLLLPNTHYYWRVKSNTTDNYSNWSPVYQFTTGNYSDINDRISNDYTDFYPNPTNDYIKIANEEITGKQFQIFSMQGNLVKEGIVNTDKIILDGLAGGVYILRIDDRIYCFIKD